jgi:hypothetical protein
MEVKEEMVVVAEGKLLKSRQPLFCFAGICAARAKYCPA